LLTEIIKMFDERWKSDDLLEVYTRLIFLGTLIMLIANDRSI
jgi:hypothetical protein